MIWIWILSTFFKITSESLVHLTCSSWENEEQVTETEVNVIESKAKRGQVYHFFGSFDSLEQAESSLKEERLWTKVGVRKYLKSTKSHQQLYRCCRVKFREKQFSAGCVVISPANKTRLFAHTIIYKLV